MNPLSPEKSKKSKTRSLKFNEDLSYVPAKLINFSATPNAKQNIPILPALTFKPVISRDYESMVRKKVSEPTVSLESSTLAPIKSAKAPIFASSKQANDLLFSDRQHTRLDFYKRPTDVSYLLDTQNYGREKNMNDYFARTITRSGNLLSPRRQASFLRKTMQTFRDKKVEENSQDNQKNDVSDTLEAKYNQKDILPETVEQLKEYITTTETEERPSTKRESMKAGSYKNENNTNSPLRNRSPPKIVDYVSAGYGNNDYFDMKENTIKEGLKKVKEKVVIQHRSQNKNLTVPSGRKEVIVLSDWLNQMLDKIYKEERIKSEDVFENIQVIYTACLQELTRQVKIQCAERGQLLDKIWEAYIDLFDRVIRENARASRELENHYLDEIEQIQKVHNLILERNMHELGNVKNERDELNSLLDTKKEELRFLKKKTERMNFDLLNQKVQVDETNREIDRLKVENNEMRKLLLESGLQAANRYADIQRMLDIKFNNKNPPKKIPKSQIQDILSDPLGDKLLYENLNLIDKLEELAGGAHIEENEEDESKVSNGKIEEELYKHIAVDTEDLKVELKAEKTNEDKEIQWEDLEPPVNQEEEQGGQEEGQVKEGEQDQEGVEEEKDPYKLKLQGQITLDEKALGELNSEEGILEQNQNIEAYEVLSSVEKRLYERFERMYDKDTKIKLTQIVLTMLRSKIGLKPEEYEVLKNKIIEMEGRSPFVSRGDVRGRRLSMDIREIDKEGLLEILEAVKSQLDHQAAVTGVEGFDEISNETFDTIMHILRKQDMLVEPVQILHPLRSLSLTYKHSKEADEAAELICYENVQEMAIDQSAKNVVEMMSQQEKINLIEKAKKRFEEDLDPDTLDGGDREMIHMLKIVVENSKELSSQDCRMLLGKSLGALNSLLSQVTNLKIKNGEQLVDIQELNEIKERQEREIADLEKELRDYRNRTGYTEKQYDKLNSKYLKLKSSFEENKKMKLQRLSWLIQNVNKFKNSYRGPRASFSYLDHAKNITEEEAIVERRAPISYIDYDHRPIIESKTESTDSNKNGQTENVDLAEQLVDNIVTLIKAEPTKDIEEEEEDEEDESWSDNDEMKQSGSHGSKQRAEAMSIDTLQGSIQDIKFLSANRVKGKKLSATNKNPFMFNQPNKMLRVLSVNADSANALLMKVKTQKVMTGGLPKLTVLKFISQIYMDRLKASGALKQTPLYIMTYDYFINKYGLKKVAENKCQQMFECVNLYQNNLRISRFRNFLGLGQMCESDEFELYFQTIKLMDPIGNGTIILSNLLEKTLINADYAELAATTLFEKKIDPQAFKLLMSRINQLKCMDKNRSMIEFEDVFEEFISIQRNLQDKVKRFVKDIFQAADLDNDEIIVFTEFDILYKHLEKEKYNEEDVKKLFFAEADMILPDDSNEKVLSFNRFAKICLERGLFSEEKQLIFARVSDSTSEIQNVQDLADNLKQQLNEIRLRFIKSETYNIQLKGIMTKLYNSIRNPLKPRNVVWLTYRLLDEESKAQLLNYQIRKILPKELLAISNFMQNYEEWSL